VVNCSASPPYYTSVPEGKHDAPLEGSMVAGYWLQIVLLLRDMSTRRKTNMTEVSQFVSEIASSFTLHYFTPFFFYVIYNSAF
jgi:hypothetical protein